MPVYRLKFHWWNFQHPRTRSLRKERDLSRNGNNTGNGRGPWDPPLDLDEFRKRGRGRFRRDLPGGRISFTVLAFGIVLLIGLWASTGIYTVQPDEQGVVLRFGKLNLITQPGLHYHLPYPFETVYTPKVTTISQINIGVSQTGSSIPAESLMLTGDENIVNIDFSVFWRIAPAEQLTDGSLTPGGAADYLFNVQEPDQTVKAVAESALREVVGRKDLQPIITEERGAVEIETQELIQRTLDAYGAGVLVTQVQLRKADPPDQVIDAFRDVVTASQDRDRTVNEARAYANKVVPEARGEAQQVIQQAEAYRAQTVVEANGQASRFNAIYKEYRRAKDVTRQRMFLETMERVLRDKNKVVIDLGPGLRARADRD